MLTAASIEDAVNRGFIKISDFKKENLNPNSYDLTLSPKLLKITDYHLDFSKPYKTEEMPIGPVTETRERNKETNEWEEGKILAENAWLLRPGECYLGSTNEIVGSPYFIPQLSGKSTTGRYFLEIHVTAGFGDLGFMGHWTLEMTVTKPTIIYPNMKVAQVAFFDPHGPIDMLYPGGYSNTEPTPIAGRPGNV